MKNEIAVSTRVALRVYWDPQSRSWWAYYINRQTTDQIGDAWFGPTRDDVLLFRPPTPTEF